MPMKWRSVCWRHARMGEMQAVGTFTGPGGEFTPPADFKRMLLSTEIWKSVQTQYPMLYISDLNEWLQRRARNYMRQPRRMDQLRR